MVVVRSWCILAKWSQVAWVLVAGSVLIVLIVVAGGLVIPWVRRRFHPSSATRRGVEQGFRIEELEAMRSRGEISDEEFRALRRAAFGLGPSPAKTGNSASSAPAGGDDDGDTTAEGDLCADGDE